MRSRDREEGILADELRRCLTEYMSGSGYDRQDEVRAALRAAGWPAVPWGEVPPPGARGPDLDLLGGIDLMVRGAGAAVENWSDVVWERAEELAGDGACFGDVFPHSLDEWHLGLIGWRDAMRAAAEDVCRPPAVGTRVVFRREFGEFPMRRMPAGLSGEVVGVDGRAPCIRVRLDQHVEQLRDWDNECHFSGQDEGLASASADYHEDCREVYVPRQA